MFSVETTSHASRFADRTVTLKPLVVSTGTPGEAGKSLVAPVGKGVGDGVIVGVAVADGVAVAVYVGVEVGKGVNVAVGECVEVGSGVSVGIVVGADSTVFGVAKAGVDTVGTIGSAFTVELPLLELACVASGGVTVADSLITKVGKGF